MAMNTSNLLREATCVTVNKAANNPDISQSVGTALYITVLSGIGERLASRIRLALFRSLVFRKMAFYDTHKVGELINRCVC